VNQEEWAAPHPPGSDGGSAAALAGQPWAPSPPWPSSGAPPPPPGGTDGFSVAALVCGILALVPVAAPLGVIGLVRTSREARRGRGLAIAGLVLSAFWVTALVGILVVTGAGGFPYSSVACVRDRCNVTMRGDQSEELSGHEVAVSDIGFGGTTFTVDGDTVSVREGETEQVGPSVVHLASVERDVAKFSIGFGGPFVDKSELENEISTGLAVDVGQVSCPRDLFAEEGISMQCRLEANDAAIYEVVVGVTKVENDQVDLDFETDYPSAAANEGASTAEELVWLQAVEQHLPKMNEVFDGIPTELTATALQQVAEGLRGCGRELARIGPASPRLQQVQELVQQACQEYDKGADCFADATEIAIPANSAEIEEFDQLLDCGFAASGLGGEPLADALVKASEMTGDSG
jgi:hypothetical protein